MIRMLGMLIVVAFATFLLMTVNPIVAMLIPLAALYHQLGKSR